MKTKLLIAIVSIISVVSVATAVKNYTYYNNTENMLCDINHDWEITLL